uniref:Uncharacterized protein n=1 Tax=Xenopus tropicalis TaxID=8364 RepID=A0A6I8QX11_XENTR
MDKPPRTNTIYTRRKYVVGGPDCAKINPKNLKLCLDDKSDMHPYSEIYLHRMEDEISLGLTCETEKTLVWHVPLRKEDLGSRSRSRSQVEYDGQHFVDRHREALISRTSNIDPVLDYLLSDFILTQEQYDTVRSKGTPQERMRQLYAHVRAWGDPEKHELYQALKSHNRALIRDLQCSPSPQ